MNAAFPRMMILLRKERGISQKQAAADLHISQALLSHYEKGIRECGLDFVVAAADYYGVSCDYLLGRTADKSGTMIAVEEIPDTDPNVRDSRMTAAGVLPVLNKKLVINSLHILFDMLQKCNDKALTAQVSEALIQTTYLVFRQMYSANQKNPRAMFSVEDYRYQTASVGAVASAVTEVGHLSRQLALEDRLPDVLPDDLQKQYPQFASSLLNLLHTAEKDL
ncbi:MAG: helix-turn-helix transcriptional regulator [Clostridia bacterium]|nr:helix-turn-helix transcriptional regulator [Clostridia bacterium]